MTSLVLFVTLLAVQPEPDARPISPAGPCRNLYRVALLPGLLEQTPGDAVALAHQADAELLKALPERFNNPTWKREVDALLSEPLAEIDLNRFDAVLKPVAKSLELWDRAARAPRADWSALTTQLRRAGLNAGFPEMPAFEIGTQLFAVQARRYLKQDRPADAVRSLGLGLGLVRHLNQCPHNNQLDQATFLADQLLDVLQDCQGHPRCPSLYDALAALPRPFLSARPVVEGQHLTLFGTLGVEKMRTDPAGTQFPPEGMQRLDRAYRIFTSYAGQRVDPLTARLQMGLAIQRSDAVAREAMRAAGYPDKVIAATPALNAALLHSLFAGEEVLGRVAEALALPAEAANERLNALDRDYPPGPPKPGTPAIPPMRFVTQRTVNLLVPFRSVERQLDLLRAVEALRLHAHRTGTLPAKLADIQAVAVPVDPLTGQPFEYQREKNVAILETPSPARPLPGLANVTLRLSLLKVEEKKP